MLIKAERTGRRSFGDKTAPTISDRAATILSPFICQRWASAFEGNSITVPASLTSGLPDRVMM